VRLGDLVLPDKDFLQEKRNDLAGKGFQQRPMLMSNEVLSLAILEPLENKEAEALQFLREFYSFMAQKGYSHDLLYRDGKDASRFVHIRIWKSNELRQEAQEDPEVHRFWMRLPEVCEITTTHQNLELLFSSVRSAVD
jgi:hypothetical protein